MFSVIAKVTNFVRYQVLLQESVTYPRNLALDRHRQIIPIDKSPHSPLHFC